MTQPRQSQHDDEKKREQMLKQALTIQRLASRLPWIVLCVSLFAFIIILLQALFFR